MNFLLYFENVPHVYWNRSLLVKKSLGAVYPHRFLTHHFLPCVIITDMQFPPPFKLQMPSKQDLCPVHLCHPVTELIAPHIVYAQWISVNEEMMGVDIVRGEAKWEGLKRHPLQLVSQLKSSGDCSCAANPSGEAETEEHHLLQPCSIPRDSSDNGHTFLWIITSHSAYITQEVSEVTWDYNALCPEHAYLIN